MPTPGGNIRFWAHGFHCKCERCDEDYAVAGPDVYRKDFIVFDNGEDFDEIILPEEQGEAVVIVDQNEVYYELRRIT
jgi:hypothetical protein